MWVNIYIIVLHKIDLKYKSFKKILLLVVGQIYIVLYVWHYCNEHFVINYLIHWSCALLYVHYIIFKCLKKLFLI